MVGWDLVKRLERPIMLAQSPSATAPLPMRDYVTDLQLHMALQARQLLPTLDSKAEEQRLVLLQRAQADLEMAASRVWL